MVKCKRKDAKLFRELRKQLELGHYKEVYDQFYDTETLSKGI